MNNIEESVLNIITEFDSQLIANNASEDIINKSLHSIMSHSQQAISFISAIEEDFDIEIDDEFINLDIFLNFNKIINLINEYKQT